MESATQSTALKGGEAGLDSVEDIVSEFYAPLQGTWKEQMLRSTRQSACLLVLVIQTCVVACSFDSHGD